MGLIKDYKKMVSMGLKNIDNIIGYNFRMGEIEAAIGLEQLKKLEDSKTFLIALSN